MQCALITFDAVRSIDVAFGRFMVFNEHNYPNMVRLFEELGVGSEKTDMSFRYREFLAAAATCFVCLHVFGCDVVVTTLWL